MEELTHFNSEGRAHMVNVGGKQITDRTATARAIVRMNPSTFSLVVEGKMKKGDVLSVSQVAGILGAKRTPDLIPMCHPIAITGANISFNLDEEKSSVIISATVSCHGVTGVEMEALTAVSVAALTIYDMCKAVQKDITIEEICLIEKTGGKSGIYTREE